MLVSEYAAERIGRLLRKTGREARRCQTDPSEDAAHDLRVTIRRFHQAMETFADALPKRARERAWRQARELLKAAGALRDTDIARALLRDSARAETAAVLELLQRERFFREIDLRLAALRWHDRKSVPELLGRLRPKPGKRKLEEMAAGLLPVLCREFFAHGREASRPGVSAEELHEFRLAAKRFRYTVELFQPLYPGSARVILGTMKRVQTLLGEINDCAATAVMLSLRGAPAILLRDLRSKERKETAEFRKAWKQMDVEGVEGAWEQALAQPVKLSARKPKSAPAAPEFEKITPAGDPRPSRLPKP